jgi:predicted glycosyltransferase involved in capsule biosynthesis
MADISQPVLTAIIPVGTDDFEFYQRRLSMRDAYDLRGVATLIVDDGCPEPVGRQLEEFCRRRNYSYLKTGAQNTPFSSSRARNAGIQVAGTEWISLEDADVIYGPDFYQIALDELRSLEIDTPFTFLTIPTIYLTEQISEDIFQNGLQPSHVRKIKRALAFENPRGAPNNNTLLHFAPASGIFLLRRKTALLAGGYDEHFIGWGGEDRDLAFRLLALPQRAQKIQLPIDFGRTKPWNLNDTVIYEGWRSLYRANGDYAGMVGLVGYHLHHEVLPWRGDSSKQNIEYAKEKAEGLAKSMKLSPMRDQLIPPDFILGRNPHLQNFQVLNALPNPVVIDETPSVDPAIFAQDLVDQNPSSILLWNPYGTSWRLEVYKELRNRKAPTIVAERGALPRSFYFDRGGLSVESDSYAEDKWNHPLSHDEAAAVRSYINELRYGSSALESQRDRVGVGMLRLRLNIASGTRLLVVPLQLFDDTVTTYFSEENRGYTDYIEEVKKLSLQLPNGWKMVYKNHPLARERYSIDGAIAADDAHINDLLEAADVVAVFNSGTGVLAMAFGKPVYVYGRTFYGIEGVNKTFIDAEQMAEDLRNGPFKIDLEKVNRYYHYLTTKFYSFADVRNSIKKQTDKSNRVVLEELYYTDIVIPGVLPVREKRRKFDIKTSILFDRYRNADYLLRKKVSEATKIPIKQTTPPLPAKPATVSRYRRPLVPIVRQFVHLLGNRKNDVQKFNKDPSGFFSGLRNPLYRRIGAILLPPSK